MYFLKNKHSLVISNPIAIPVEIVILVITNPVLDNVEEKAF